MTLLDIVSKIRDDELVTVSCDEILIDCMLAGLLRGSKHFQDNLADKEVVTIGVGLFNDLVIHIEE